MCKLQALENSVHLIVHLKINSGNPARSTICGVWSFRCGGFVDGFFLKNKMTGYQYFMF
jgi:hypothetical protein